MSTYQTVHTVSTQISQIKQLNGKAATFPIWRSRMEDILGLQGTLDIVKGTPTRPTESPKDDSGTGRSNETVKPASRLFSTIVNAYEKNTCACRIQLQDAFWNAKHDPNEPIALWIGQIRVAADQLISAKQLLNDQQIANRLVGGLNKSWATIRDTVVYASTELLLDNTTGALEAHEVTLMSNEGTSDLISAVAATTKRVGCSNCGRFGHRSINCCKPKGHTKAKAGAAQAVKLGGLDSDSYDDQNKLVYASTKSYHLYSVTGVELLKSADGAAFLTNTEDGELH
ncbi:hypothetical protein MJO29_009078 [Puccinia striiformis f. sp. tritici]|nr:hypothetical protein MJO29_009078 [Puccinia striiformis f. sp. tritici]